MYNWGILGCGRIAVRMAEALKLVPDAVLYAAGSRSTEKAEAFREENGFLKAYGSYEELCNDENVDIVYIATPHNYHVDAAILAMNHGKHVLIEKPMTVNTKGMDEIIKTASENKVFCMEGMWMRFFPVYEKVLDWIKSGRIGDIVSVSADFCITVPVDDMGCRLSNPDLAGGALLDLGVYPLNFAAMFLGSCPKEIQGVAAFSPAGVDMNDSVSLLYENNAAATLQTSLLYKGSDTGYIYGTKGHIKIPHYIWADSAELFLGKELAETAESFFEKGFQYEVSEVHRCIAQGKQESEIMPLCETRNITAIMDQLRARWNFIYPFE